MNAMYTDNNLRTVTDLVSFLNNPVVTDVILTGTLEERSDWILERLLRFKYLTLKKKDKGIIIQYIGRMTGLAEKQVDRYIRAFKVWQRLGHTYSRRVFPITYTREDSWLLAEVDNATGRLSWGLTIALMKDEYLIGDIRFVRLKDISVAQLYRLRSTSHYKEESLVVGKTKSVNIPIGIRMKPNPEGLPWFIRVDTVHQGDLNGEKWVYHVNLVDEITQWEVMFAVEEISERFLLPLLKWALATFPFEIKNFHSDNGSEFINYKVAALLEKLRVSQTKSRARKSTDNGLVECKNGAIIRKEFGHWHIPGVFAPRINRFYMEHFIPYLNFYRPCHFPEKVCEENGKVRILYTLKNCMTPYQKLISLPNWESHLRKEFTKELLQRLQKRKTPLQAAKEKKKARDELMKVALPKFLNILPVIMTDG